MRVLPILKILEKKYIIWFIIIITSSIIIPNKIAAQLQSSSNQNIFHEKVPGIAVGSLPVCTAFNPRTNMLYVCNAASNTVSVIECTTNTVITTIPITGNFPSGITVDRLTNRVYVTTAYSPTITEIDGSTNRIIGSITISGVPTGITSDRQDHLYIIYQNSPNVTTIQGETHQFIKNNTITAKPSEGIFHLTAIAFDPKTENVYVADSDDNKIHIVGYQVAIPVGSHPNSIDVNPITGMIYVTNMDDSSISIINIPTVEKKAIPSVKTIPLNKTFEPTAIAVNPNKNITYVADRFYGKVYVIDENDKYKIDTVTVSTPESNYKYIGLIASRDIGITVSPYTNMVYVTNQYANRVTVINGQTNAISVGASFNINPRNSGDISCDEKIVPANYIFYDVNSTHNCKAVPHGGFSFSSWSDSTLKANSNNPINLKASDFGISWTANFTPTLSLDQYESIIVAYLAILGPISTILSVRIWFNSRKQKKYLKTYMETIDRKCNSLDQHKEEESLKDLENLRQEIRSLLIRGTISDATYNVLKDRISECDQKMKK